MTTEQRSSITLGCTAGGKKFTEVARSIGKPLICSSSRNKITRCRVRRMCSQTSSKPKKRYIIIKKYMAQEDRLQVNFFLYYLMNPSFLGTLRWEITIFPSGLKSNVDSQTPSAQPTWQTIPYQSSPRYIGLLWITISTYHFEWVRVSYLVWNITLDWFAEKQLPTKKSSKGWKLTCYACQFADIFN